MSVCRSVTKSKKKKREFEKKWMSVCQSQNPKKKGIPFQPVHYFSSNKNFTFLHSMKITSLLLVSAPRRLEDCLDWTSLIATSRACCISTNWSILTLGFCWRLFPYNSLIWSTLLLNSILTLCWRLLPLLLVLVLLLVLLLLLLSLLPLLLV